jgi:hypothetical protein
MARITTGVAWVRRLARLILLMKTSACVPNNTMSTTRPSAAGKLPSSPPRNRSM